MFENTGYRVLGFQLALFFICFSGCNHPIKKALIGTWVIDIESIETPPGVPWECLSPNIFDIDCDGQGMFPGFDVGCAYSYRPNSFFSSWEIEYHESGSSALIVKNAKGDFPSILNFSFGKEGSWFLLRMWSDSLAFTARKNNYDFNGNRKLIDRVIEMTIK